MAVPQQTSAGVTPGLNSDRPPVLVLGSGITPLGVIRILARQGLQPLAVGAVDSLVPRSRWYRPLALPAGADASGEALAAWLAQLPLERAVLMPCSDAWVLRVAALDPGLRARFPASVSPASTLERFVDKGRFAELLHETGTPHPWSLDVRGEADLESLPEEAFSSTILKPRDSQRFFQRFGVKAFHAHARAEAQTQLAMLSAEGFPVILQDYVAGPARNHYFIDGFIDRLGSVRAVFVRQRLRMYPPDFGNSTFMVSVPPAEARPAVDSLTALLGAAGYRGIFSAEFKRDARDGTFKILEVNARPWWYVEFAARCGVDVCRMAYDDALERPVQTVARYAIGRRLVYPYYDRLACTEARRRAELSLWSWLRSWAGAAQPVFMWRDPMPAVREAWSTLRGFVAGHLRGLGGGRRASGDRPVSGGGQ